MNRTLLTSIGLTLATVVLAATIGYAQAAPPGPLDGTWTGKVTADMGEMAITGTFVTKNGIVSGVLSNPHGEFKIADGKLVEGKWVLPFSTGDGMKGKLTGVPKGDTFSGEWDFRPQAFGTFELTRSK